MGKFWFNAFSQLKEGLSNMADQIAVDLRDAIQQLATPLHSERDLDPLIERIGDARYVLLGEATHGTSEYYLWRVRLSKRLIAEKGFRFIAVEGDWPDCYRVNRYVKSYIDGGTAARDVLNSFTRWPTWMWANWEVVALVEWLRRHNEALPPERRIGFYGLDVYSLWESLAEVSDYLQTNAPDALKAAQEAFACFQPYHEDPTEYAYATHLVPTSCEREVIQLLHETAQRAHVMRDGWAGDQEAAFSAEQNARVAVDAERYYRATIWGGPESWNLRDTHMVDTLDRLMRFHEQSNSASSDQAKAIVWEHNTHIGDARATPMHESGMTNVGQLVRERHSAEGVVLVGFGSYIGSVIAGRTWGAPLERMPVREARYNSWEAQMHHALGDNGLFVFPSIMEGSPFEETRGHRAIGVVYDPEAGNIGGFVPTALSQRYDAFLYLDETRALHPLHLEPETTAPTPPDTYPFGV